MPIKNDTLLKIFKLKLQKGLGFTSLENNLIVIISLEINKILNNI